MEHLRLGALSYSFTDEEAFAARRSVVVTNHTTPAQPFEIWTLGHQAGAPPQQPASLFAYGEAVGGVAACANGAALPVGASCSIVLDWAPRVKGGGDLSGRLELRRPGTATALATLPLSADGFTRAGFSASAINVSVVAGEPANLALEILNSGDQGGRPFVALDPRPEDTHGGRFSVSDSRPNACARQIEPDERCSWPIGFDSAAPGVYTTRVAISEGGTGVSWAPLRVTVLAPPPPGAERRRR